MSGGISCTSMLCMAFMNFRTIDWSSSTERWISLKTEARWTTELLFQLSKTKVFFNINKLDIPCHQWNPNSILEKFLITAIEFTSCLISNKTNYILLIIIIWVKTIIWSLLVVIQIILNLIISRIRINDEHKTHASVILMQIQFAFKISLVYETYQSRISRCR